MFDCPKCVTVCKQPHCVTHCQAPKPECEPVCEEPKCDWKCKKPACPKPKCELVCENPNCVPKVECCNCGLGAPAVSPPPFPMFKETEVNKNCCGCGNDKYPRFQSVASENPQVFVDSKASFSQRPQVFIENNGERIIKDEINAQVNMLPSPQPIGVGQYLPRVSTGSDVWNRDIRINNLDQIHNDLRKNVLK